MDDLDFMIGEIAFEANPTDDRRLQRRLDALCDLISEAVEGTGA